MGEIDHDAEAVELADDGAAEGVEAAVARGVGRRIDPIEAFVVAKRHQPHARRVPDAQGAQRILQSGAALDRDEGRDLAQGFRLGVVRGPPRRQEHIRMSLLDAADEIDLLERGARRMGRVGRLERGPELRPHHALAQARNVGVRALMNAHQIIGQHVAARGLVDSDDPCKIIVPVEQRRAPQDVARHRERIVDRRRGSARRRAARSHSVHRDRDETHHAFAVRNEQKRRLLRVRLRAPDRLGDVARAFNRLMIDLLDDIARPQTPFRRGGAGLD